MIRKKIIEICDNSDKFKANEFNTLIYKKVRIYPFGEDFSDCVLYIKDNLIELNEKETKLIIKYFKDKYLSSEKRQKEKAKNKEEELLNSIKF